MAVVALDAGQPVHPAFFPEPGSFNLGEIWFLFCTLHCFPRSMGGIFPWPVSA